MTIILTTLFRKLGTEENSQAFILTLKVKIKFPSIWFFFLEEWQHTITNKFYNSIILPSSKNIIHSGKDCQGMVKQLADRLMEAAYISSD